MTRNKLEKIFSESMRAKFSWGMKLHNNPLAHQNTPADFIFTHIVDKLAEYKNSGFTPAPDKVLELVQNSGFYVVLAECKQVTCENGKGRLAFKRLKQLHDLLAFVNANPLYHKAFFCIAFWDERWDRSDVFFVPVAFMQEIITSHGAESINRQDAIDRLSKYRVSVDRGVLQLQL